MSAPAALVAIFCRAPRPGHTKTRLQPELGAEGAAAFSVALLLDVVGAASDPRWDVELWAAGERDRGPLAALAPGVGVRVQKEGDLGQRLADCFAATASSYPATVIIGSDCPGLRPGHIEAGLDALNEADAAICPGRDGGYGLIAARCEHPPLFTGIDWGTGRVADQTRLAARRSGLVLAEPCGLDDVDDPADLAALAGDAALARNPTALGRTRAVLAKLPEAGSA